MMDIGILGGGAFGTALAKLLEARGHRITIWCFPAEEARMLAATRESVRLPGFKVGPDVLPSEDVEPAVTGKEIVILVTPSHTARAVLAKTAALFDAQSVLVVGTKGIEEETLLTMSQVVREVLPAPVAQRAAFVSGPTFARELASGLPAAIVVASRSPASAELVQREFSTDRLRLYTSDDVAGVELGGALKNVCAIGAGISDGLGYGHNARAALITRGLFEMARIGMRMGANPLTFAGLAGMGDLVLTCTSDLSRNRQVGLELGRGRKLDEILTSLGAVAEGVKTTRAARQLAMGLEVDIPITEVIYQVLYEGKQPNAALAELMARELKPERG
ncbi:MAG: NAD(P)H-dependent glycerol-3-phosphate dehydrogenase [Pseudomonadota bacterium]